MPCPLLPIDIVWLHLPHSRLMSHLQEQIILSYYTYPPALPARISKSHNSTATTTTTTHVLIPSHPPSSLFFSPGVSWLAAAIPSDHLAQTPPNTPKHKYIPNMKSQLPHLLTILLTSQLTSLHYETKIPHPRHSSLPPVPALIRDRREGGREGGRMRLLPSLLPHPEFNFQDMLVCVWALARYNFECPGYNAATGAFPSLPSPSTMDGQTKWTVRNRKGNRLYTHPYAAEAQKQDMNKNGPPSLYPYP